MGLKAAAMPFIDVPLPIVYNVWVEKPPENPHNSCNPNVILDHCRTT
jgi:hypothetical protein